MVVNVSALKNMLNRKLSNTRVRRRLIALDKSVHFFTCSRKKNIDQYNYVLNELPTHEG